MPVINACRCLTKAEFIEIYAAFMGYQPGEIEFTCEEFHTSPRAAVGVIEPAYIPRDPSEETPTILLVYDTKVGEYAFDSFNVYGMREQEYEAARRIAYLMDMD